VLLALILVTAIDVFLLRGAETTETKWGTIRPLSQYLLILLAVTFTWLMGLMGYVRSGLRQHWHVYGVIRDTSPDAFTPTLGFATKVVSVTVLIFFLMIGFIFWLASLSGKKNWRPKAVPVPEPAHLPEGGGLAPVPGSAAAGGPLKYAAPDEPRSPGEGSGAPRSDGSWSDSSRSDVSRSDVSEREP
jgi:hypothetical protein